MCVQAIVEAGPEVIQRRPLYPSQVVHRKYHMRGIGRRMKITQLRQPGKRNIAPANLYQQPRMIVSVNHKWQENSLWRRAVGKNIQQRIEMSEENNTCFFVYNSQQHVLYNRRRFKHIYELLFHQIKKISVRP